MERERRIKTCLLVIYCLCQTVPKLSSLNKKLLSLHTFFCESGILPLGTFSPLLITELLSWQTSPLFKHCSFPCWFIQHKRYRLVSVCQALCTHFARHAVESQTAWCLSFEGQESNTSVWHFLIKPCLCDEHRDSRYCNTAVTSYIVTCYNW